MGGHPLAILFRLLVTLTVVAGWVLMAIGVALFFSEGPDTPHDGSHLVYAAGFCSAAIASLLTAVRLRAGALVLALPFAGLGGVAFWVAEMAAFGPGLSCRGGCPPESARDSQNVLDVAWAAYANLLVAAAIVVLPLILAIIRSAAGTAPRASSDDAERPK